MTILARPLTWLSAALAGVVAVCAGLGIDAYRHRHGADAAELISFESPGLLVAFAGLAVVAFGLLSAVSLLSLQAAPSPEAALRRGAGVLVAWMAVAVAAVVAVTYTATAGVTIGHGAHGAAVQHSVASTRGGNAEPSDIPGIDARVTLRGTLTLDGAPLVARFLGARVMREGLPAACQATIPEVTDGRYEFQVMADAEVRGCGASGAQILLWAHDGERYFFSRETTPWPDGSSATFDATFSTAERDSARTRGTGFYGEVFERDGSPVAGGAVIEAYVGDTRCGVTSVRYSGFAGFTIGIAGPDVPGCAADGTITFRIDGRPARETALNYLDPDDEGHNLNLTLE